MREGRYPVIVSGIHPFRAQIRWSVGDSARLLKGLAIGAWSYKSEMKIQLGSGLSGGCRCQNPVQGGTVTVFAQQSQYSSKDKIGLRRSLGVDGRM